MFSFRPDFFYWSAIIKNTPTSKIEFALILRFELLLLVRKDLFSTNEPGGKKYDITLYFPLAAARYTNI